MRGYVIRAHGPDTDLTLSRLERAEYVGYILKWKATLRVLDVLAGSCCPES